MKPRLHGSVQLPIDLMLVALAWWLAFWLRFNLDIPGEQLAVLWRALPWVLAVYAASLLLLRNYRFIWRYTSLSEMIQLGYAMLLAAMAAAATLLMLRIEALPRSVLLLHPMLALLALAGARAAARLVLGGRRRSGSGRPLIVVGSLNEVAAALPALDAAIDWSVVGIVTPEAAERGQRLRGAEVLGGLADLPHVARAVDATGVLVASPPGSEVRRRALIAASDAGLPLLTLPRPDDWLQPGSSRPRRVALEDLLGRAPVQLDSGRLSDALAGRAVMVTGAGGSIGGELCRQIARYGVSEMVCLDMSEFAVYQLEQSLRKAHPQLRCHYYTANVREPDRIEALMSRHRPAVVLHAAAYKHVPIMEDLNEIEALRTNVLGTLNVARAAGRCGVGRFVMVSTDKAVNPTNVMGASKRLAELVVQGVAREHASTHFVSVRFGNVLGSSGSVVPLFEQQIAQGGPVTVTHPDIVRYFMTIPEAAQLVLQAGLMGLSGQIFVLDMGEPVRIADLARMMIRLSGRTEQEVPIVFTGLRPGEKLYEELLAGDETTEPTPHPKLRIAKTGAGGGLDVSACASWILDAGPLPPPDAVRTWLRAQLPEYRPAGA